MNPDRSGAEPSWGPSPSAPPPARGEDRLSAAEAHRGGSGPFAPGDFCYYAPWGNLAFFYAGYRYSRDLASMLVFAWNSKKPSLMGDGLVPGSLVAG
ncbi:cyclophilin-like fold protein [Inquilinus sp. Marseille-Q2685]|uniref:cyclophilin-like fold protein n=1 Tax=Inquilinus sp. Marseille-Q2685 TaxID=2866581 RepID=UPI001CE3F732